LRSQPGEDRERFHVRLLSDRARLPRTSLFLFLIVAVVWGIPFLFIKLAVEEGLSPAFVAWARVTVATVVLLPIAWRAGALRNLRLQLRPLIAFAIFEMALPFPLIAAGEQAVTSSFAAILMASSPLAVALLALRFDRSEVVTGARLLGIGVGLAGVITLVGVDVAGRFDELVGAVLVVVATFAYAAATMLYKHYFGGAAPIGPIAGAVTVSAIVLTPAAAVTWPSQLPSVVGWGSVLTLGVVCSAVGMLAFFRLVSQVGASRATVVAYLFPIVAVGVGWITLGEAIGKGGVIGLPLILMGSWLATSGGRLPAPVLRRWQALRAPDQADDAEV